MKERPVAQAEERGDLVREKDYGISVMLVRVQPGRPVGSKWRFFYE